MITDTSSNPLQPFIFPLSPLLHDLHDSLMIHTPSCSTPFQTFIFPLSPLLHDLHDSLMIHTPSCSTPFQTGGILHFCYSSLSFLSLHHQLAHVPPCSHFNPCSCGLLPLLSRYKEKGKLVNIVRLLISYSQNIDQLVKGLVSQIEGFTRYKQGEKNRRERDLIICRLSISSQ